MIRNVFIKFPLSNYLDYVYKMYKKHKHVITTFRRQRQGSHKFKASLRYMVSLGSLERTFQRTNENTNRPPKINELPLDSGHLEKLFHYVYVNTPKLKANLNI